MGDDGGSGEEEQRRQAQVSPSQRTEQQDRGCVEQRQPAPAKQAAAERERGQREEAAVVGQVGRLQLRDVEQPRHGGVLERIAPQPHAVGRQERRRRAAGCDEQSALRGRSPKAARPYPFAGREESDGRDAEDAFDMKVRPRHGDREHPQQWPHVPAIRDRSIR